MDDITDASVISYRDELIVEVLGTDEYGSLDVVSYQFDYDNESRHIVVPKQSVDREHLTTIETALEDEGYRMASVEH